MASLSGEVVSNLAIDHVFKSGEQVYFKTKTIYSDSVTEFNISGSSQTSDAKPNKLKAGLAAVKKAVDDALTGSDNFSHTNSQLETLRDDVAVIKKENQQLRKELDELRQLLKNDQSFLVLTRKALTGTFAYLGKLILILGDGNLSFSLALARLFPEKKIIATVLESRNEFLSKYLSGASTLCCLNNLCPNVDVIFKVDATSHKDLLNIKQQQSDNFSDIIMNFPHHGGKSNLKKSKILLENIFNCVSTCLMDVNVTRFHISFAKAQSGINYEDVLAKTTFLKKDILPNHNPDSWQAIYIGAKFALKVNFTDVFCPFNFPGYECTGYLNQEQRFHNKNIAITLSFVKAYDKLLSKINLESAILLENNVPKKSELFHAFRPYFTHDISILFTPNFANVDAIEIHLRQLFKQFANNLIVRVQEITLLRTRYNNFYNRIYRLWWQGVSLPLSREITLSSSTKTATTAAAPASTADADDFDLFESDEEQESEEQKRIHKERLAAYAAKKSKKPSLIAKSSVILDVKPWDDETDMKEMERLVRTIKLDGLLWGAAKLIPIGYGIHKLQIVSTIEDEKVSVDADLVERIQDEFSDHVQSVDIAAFNKI